MKETGEELQDFEDFDDAPAAHNKLLSAVTQLYEKKRVKASTRTEPSLEVSEFHLSKLDKKHGQIKVTELAKALNKHANLANISNKLINAQKRAKTLPKPLEKIHQDKINRKAGFELVKRQLNRWDSIVYQQKVAEQLTFPLDKSDPISVFDSSNLPSKFWEQSELHAELGKILNKPQQNGDVQSASNQEGEYPQQLADVLEKRKLMAKIRAQKSYQESKLARQSKIKSKRYHQIKKKARVKEQLRQFEALKNDDPEAALKKLEELERTRAEERLTLRHRSTGQWAKNLAVRAKYDKDARIALSEQLKQSKELTVKANKSDSDYESDKEEIQPAPVEGPNNPMNPWVTKQQEMDEDFANYRKFWMEKEQAEIRDKIKDTGEAVKKTEEAVKKTEEAVKKTEEAVKKTEAAVKKTGGAVKDTKIKVSASVATKKHRQLNSTTNVGSWIVSSTKDKTVTNPVRVSKKRPNPSCTFVISDSKKTKSDKSLDKMFEEVEDKIKEVVKNKFEKKKNEFMNLYKTNPDKDCHDKEENVPSLEFKKKNSLADIDEELIQLATDKSQDTTDNLTKTLMTANTTITGEVKETENINPNKFHKLTQRFLLSQAPEIMGQGDDALDDEEKPSGRLTMTEAFAEEDIVKKFQKEKDEHIKKNKISDVDLTMPGWGSWGGHKMSLARRRRKKFVIKFPKALPRKDMNRGNVIINEDAEKTVQEHQVKEVPFPFTSVQDYEASIRAPLGNTWISQLAHQKVTMPPIVTKMGTVIRPMDDSQLC